MHYRPGPGAGYVRAQPTANTHTNQRERCISTAYMATYAYKTLQVCKKV